MSKQSLRDALEEAGVDAEAARDLPPTANARIRRTPTKDPSAVYSVRIPVAELEHLRIFAESRGMTPSGLLRQWVIERLQTESEDLAVHADQIAETAARLRAIASDLESSMTTTAV